MSEDGPQQVDAEAPTLLFAEAIQTLVKKLESKKDDIRKRL